MVRGARALRIHRDDHQWLLWRGRQGQGSPLAAYREGPHRHGSGRTAFERISSLEWHRFDPKPYRDRRGSKRWDKKQNPVADVGHTPCRTWDTPVCRTGDTPKSESVSDVGHIRNEPGVTDVGHISSLTTGGCPEVVSSALKIPSETIVAQPDPRLRTRFIKRSQH